MQKEVAEFLNGTKNGNLDLHVNCINCAENENKIF